jgi:hypothetical protein
VKKGTSVSTYSEVVSVLVRFYCCRHNDDFYSFISLEHIFRKKKVDLDVYVTLVDLVNYEMGDVLQVTIRSDDLQCAPARHVCYSRVLAYALV